MHLIVNMLCAGFSHIERCKLDHSENCCTSQTFADQNSGKHQHYSAYYMLITLQYNLVQILCYFITYWCVIWYT